MDNGYSLSDIVTAVGSSGGLSGIGGSGLITILLIFALLNGGFGVNGGDYGRYATAASQQEILFGQQFQGLDNKIDRLGNGVADATFSLNNTIHNAQDVVAGAVTTEGRTMQNMLSGYQLESQKNIDSVRYDMANFANAINKNIDDKYAQLEKNQMQAQIDAQAAELNKVYIAQQLQNVVRYPNGWTYNAGTSPFCGGYGCCN